EDDRWVEALPGMGAAAQVQDGQRLAAVPGGVHVDGKVRAAQGAQRDVDVVGAVVDQQDGGPEVHGAASLLPGRLRKKRAPRPGSLSAQARPPWRSAARRTIARPTPAPGNSSRE